MYAGLLQGPANLQRLSLSIVMVRCLQLQVRVLTSMRSCDSQCETGSHVPFLINRVTQYSSSHIYSLTAQFPALFCFCNVDLPGQHHSICTWVAISCFSLSLQGTLRQWAPVGALLSAVWIFPALQQGDPLTPAATSAAAAWLLSCCLAAALEVWMRTSYLQRRRVRTEQQQADCGCSKSSKPLILYGKACQK
jgi:hypothetical protein